MLSYVWEWLPVCASGPLDNHPTFTHIHTRQCGQSVLTKDTTAETGMGWGSNHQPFGFWTTFCAVCPLLSHWIYLSSLRPNFYSLILFNLSNQCCWAWAHACRGTVFRLTLMPNGVCCSPAIITPLCCSLSWRRDLKHRVNPGVPEENALNATRSFSDLLCITWSWETQPDSQLKRAGGQLL